MARRAYKTVNVPRELAEWVDHILAPGQQDPTKAPLGIQSRDEFFKLGAAILATALVDPATGQVPRRTVQELLDKLEYASNGEDAM